MDRQSNIVIVLKAIHSGSRPYLQTSDLARKACQGQNTLAYFEH
jgi:hypothetical protein